MQLVLFARDGDERTPLGETQHLSCIVLQEVDAFGDVAVRFGPALPHFEHEQRVELVAALPHRLRCGEEQLRALLRRDPRPSSEGVLRGTNGGASLLDARRRDAADDLTRMRGIDGGELALGAHAATTDDEVVVPLFGAHARDRCSEGFALGRRCKRADRFV